MIVNISFSFKYIGENKMISTHECNFSRLIEKKMKEIEGPIFYIEPLDMININFRKKLVVIGGFSGCFKTTLALNMVYNNAFKMGYNCGFLSLEMETDDILLRLLVIHANHPKYFQYKANITLQKILNNQLTEDEKHFLFQIVEPDLKDSVGKIIVLDIEDFLYLSNGLNSLIPQIDIKLLEITKYPYLDLLVIDYIQLLARVLRNQFPGTFDQYQVLSQLIRQIKHITQTYNNTGISVVVLSQLNRSSYSAIKERIRNPRINESDRYKDIYDLTAISESSEIVNAADIVLSIYTDDKLKKDHEAVIQLLKNRFGETIEEGVRILAHPEFSYVGDFITHETYMRTSQELWNNYIYNLIRGKNV
jgi:replicative DNA helicase